MEFIYDDGGRAAAGYRGTTGDCVCRSIAIATGKPYAEVYDALNILGKDERITRKRPKRSSSRTGVRMATMKKYLASLGWRWLPTMGIGTGCTVHLSDGELPHGRLIVRLSGHITCVIDGVIHDTYSPERNEHTCERFPGWQTCKLKPGQTRNENGICYVSRRCVYGYFFKPGH